MFRKGFRRGWKQYSHEDTIFEAEEEEQNAFGNVLSESYWLS